MPGKSVGYGSHVPVKPKTVEGNDKALGSFAAEGW